MMISLLIVTFADIVLGEVFPCDSQIYCHGKLLETVQKSEIFKESKVFVDMKIKGWYGGLIVNSASL